VAMFAGDVRLAKKLASVFGVQIQDFVGVV